MAEMKDVEYVKAVLKGDYTTHHGHELPYPNLNDVIRATSFDYIEGTVEGERPNNSKSREGHDYLWFQHGKKPILTHRFIVAITLGKWPPRDFDVDHVNHNPSDNRPSNLRVVTRRDNVGNRRKALLSDLFDFADVVRFIEDIQASPDEEEHNDDVDLVFEPEADTVAIPEQPIEFEFVEPKPKPRHAFVESDPEPVEKVSSYASAPFYTGETKPAKYGGAWYKTTLDSWHLLYKEPDFKK